MSTKKPISRVSAKTKAEVSLVRSSAAEYLTFVAASAQGGIEVVYSDENIWLSQKMMGLLYDVDVRTISYHLQKIFADKELEEKSVIQFFRITAADGKIYDTGHYKLSAVVAVGYKVNSERAVQFRKWATGIIESFTIKGFAMDDERLKNDGSVLGKKYFEESDFDQMLKNPPAPAKVIDEAVLQVVKLDHPVAEQRNRDFYRLLLTGGKESWREADAVQNLHTVVPLEKLVAAFRRFVGPFFVRINQNIAHSRPLATLRATLLPKLLSGALSVEHLTA